MNINTNWVFYKLNKPENKQVVQLPYDAMIREERDPNSPAKDKIAFFKGDDYAYEKELDIKITGKETIYLEFEGVYHDATIYINGVKAHERHYGYISFIFDATPYLKDGKNLIKVVAINSDQPNSRWYSGSGIYRNVNLYNLPKLHILPRSFKIATLDYKNGQVEIKAKFTEKCDSELIIKDIEGKEVYKTSFTSRDEITEIAYINSPKLWSADHPYLYTATLKIKDQDETIKFGIRTIQLNKEKGLLINGERTILYGCCIHSDNALFGAESYKEVEYRKVRQIKELGYNAVRSAHNPIVKDFLDACDELGLYVMDEYVDCWYIPKTKYDYTKYMRDEYEKDLFDIVEKDYSHPSVIMYSIGNEVSETAYDEGIELTRKLVDLLHELDPNRYVTCGINVYFNGISRKPYAIYSSANAEKDSTTIAKPTTSSSDFFNNLTNVLGVAFMKRGCKSKTVGKYTKGAFEQLDIAGYNYGINRYEQDLKNYPDRFICGTETFIFDVAKFHELVEKHPRIIGDFVWTGLDYLGEAGFASMINKKDYPYMEDPSGWLTDEGARKDIIGITTSEGNYQEVVHRLKTIDIGVVSPHDIICGHRLAGWRFNNAIKSYTFDGYEKKKCIFYVYANSPYIKFYQNGKLIKSAKIDPEKCFIKFNGRYIPGEIKAVALDKNKQTILSTTILKTAGKDTYIGYYKEQLPEEKRFAFVHLDVVDSNGIIKPHHETDIEITNVKGATLLRFGSPNSYNKIGYMSNKVNTYHGMSMAIFEYIEKEFSFEVKSSIENKVITIKRG